MGGREETVGETVANAVEAKVVAELVAALMQAGANASDIGIISPYRAQVH
jgi:superfamily I DNA and/or RNA helicase